eukprot:6801555-Ditylum_brightwellii.AAC.1
MEAGVVMAVMVEAKDVVDVVKMEKSIPFHKVGRRIKHLLSQGRIIKERKKDPINFSIGVVGMESGLITIRVLHHVQTSQLAICPTYLPPQTVLGP